MKKILNVLTKNSKFIRFLNIQSITIVFTILLGKFIATYYTPDNFGEYSVISATIAFFTATIVSPLIQSYRFLFNSTKYIDLNNFYLSGFTYLYIILVVIILGLSAIFQFSFVILSVCVLTFIFQTYQAIYGAGINLKGFNDKYAKIQVLLPTTNLAFLVASYFIFADTRFITLLTGVLFAQILGFIFFYKSLIEHRNFKFLSITKILSDEKLRKVINFIRPLIILPVFSWMVNSSDKFFIKYYLDSHAVGIYSAAYGIGSKIFIAVAGILILWTNASTYAKINENMSLKGIKDLVVKRLKNYFGIGMIVVLLLSIFSGIIGKILLSNQYAEGFYLIGLLAFSSLIMTCFHFWEQAIYALGLTKIITLHYFVGAVTNVTLNFLLIPVYGILGAAISVILSSSIQYVALIFLFDKYSKKSVLSKL